MDTSALIYLAGLKEPDLKTFKTKIKTTRTKLIISHVQVDESTVHIKFHERTSKKCDKEVQTYQQKIDEALKALKNKGINIRVEPTRIMVCGVSRLDLTRLSGEEIGDLYDQLRTEIDTCQKKKGKPKSTLNIACDAVIAVSSMKNDFLITCDECLYRSWTKVIKKNKGLMTRFSFPKAYYAKRSPKAVSGCVLGLVT